MNPIRALVFAVLACHFGCSSTGQFECDLHTDCEAGGLVGECRAEGFCAFPDAACGDKGRWDDSARHDLAGLCVGDGPGDDPKADGPNLCGGVSVLAKAPGSPCGPCGAGAYECDSLESVACAGAPSLDTAVAHQGEVSAESTYGGLFAWFYGFYAELAIDDNLETSWFSNGPDAGGTRFVWKGARQECITNITIEGNAANADVDLREDHGFGEVVVQIKEGDEVVFSQRRTLDGTPDPTTHVDTGAVRGDSVELQFLSHEHGDCGGFAELRINALR